MRALHHHVVIFDNAGIGPTHPLGSPLTIDAEGRRSPSGSNHSYRAHSSG
jgi:hypothetical protein